MMNNLSAGVIFALFSTVTFTVRAAPMLEYAKLPKFNRHDQSSSLSGMIGDTPIIPPGQARPTPVNDIESDLRNLESDMNAVEYEFQETQNKPVTDEMDAVEREFQETQDEPVTDPKRVGRVNQMNAKLNAINAKFQELNLKSEDMLRIDSRIGSLRRIIRAALLSWNHELGKHDHDPEQIFGLFGVMYDDMVAERMDQLNNKRDKPEPAFENLRIRASYLSMDMKAMELRKDSAFTEWSSQPDNSKGFKDLLNKAEKLWNLLKISLDDQRYQQHPLPRGQH